MLSIKYGDRLLCVRYKYDPQKGRRYTTVELIEEVMDRHSHTHAVRAQQAEVLPQRLGVKVEYWEEEIREKVKMVGGIWMPR